MPDGLMDFIVNWGPTLLFIIIVLCAIVLGMIRGFRKSVILFIHMLVVGVLCLCFYLWIVNQKEMDAILVKQADTVLGWMGQSVHQLLDVEAKPTLTEMLTEKILASLSEEEKVIILIQGNTAYIQTLVEASYRLFLFIVSLVVYVLLIFLLYLIYFIAYPVRRKIRKVNRRFQNGEISHPYRKKRLLGGLVGGVRGLISALVCFSFIGALFFIVSGGKKAPSREELGNGTEISFGDEQYDELYDYYSAICAMGNQGIFKLLNSFQDSTNTPYYFYIADLVLQGGLTDEGLGVVDETFYIRDELGYYVGFCKDALTLLVQYAGDDLSVLLNPSEENINEIFQIMQKPGFADDLKELVDSFEEKTYFVNLSLSVLTTMINHIDAFVEDEKVVGLIECMFLEEDSIKVTDLATKDDVKYLFNSLIDVISLTDISSYDNPNQIAIAYAEKAVPSLVKLSCFKDQTRKEKANRWIGKIYEYCAENLIESDIELPDVTGVDWMDEFTILLNASAPILSITNQIYSDEQELLLKNFFTLFEGTSGLQMQTAYDQMMGFLSESVLLGVVCQMSFVQDTFDQLLQQITENSEAHLPLENITFENRQEGDQIIYGEIYKLLNALKDVLQNGGETLYQAVMDLENDTQNMKVIADILVKPLQGEVQKTLVDSLFESDLLYFYTSGILTNLKMDGFEIYIPDEVVDPETDLILREELLVLIHGFAGSAEVILDLMGESSEIDFEKILLNEPLNQAIRDSLILEGTVSNLLIEQLKQVEMIVLPENYQYVESWLSKEEDGELQHLLQALKHAIQSDSFDINALMEGDFEISSLKSLSTQTLEMMLESSVLHYTLSQTLTSISTDDFEVVIPYDSSLGIKQDYLGNSVQLIQEDELVRMIRSVLNLLRFSETEQTIDYAYLFEHIEDLLKSDIIQATLIHLIVQMAGTDGLLAVPQNYLAAVDTIKTAPLSQNIWFGSTEQVTDDEMYRLLTVLASFIGDVSSDFDLTTDLESKLIFTEQNITNLSSSVVLNATLTKNIIQTNVEVPLSVYENEQLTATELNALLGLIIDLFGHEENGVQVFKLSDFESFSFDVENKSFTRSDINRIFSSEILTFQLSKALLPITTIVIPMDVVSHQKIYDATAGSRTESILLKTELKNVLTGIFDLFATEDTIQMGNLSFEEMTLQTSDVQTIIQSHILSATVSEQICKANALVIPKDSVVWKEIYLLEQSKAIIQEEEFESFLLSLFNLFAVDGKLVISGTMNFQSVSITLDTLNQLLESLILQATLSDQLLTNRSLIVPKEVTRQMLDRTGASIQLIQKEELQKLLSAVFTIVGQDTITLSDLSLETIAVPQDATSLTSSTILRAVVSNQLLTQNDLAIVQKDDESYDVMTAQTDEKIVVLTSTELSSLIAGIHAVGSGDFKKLELNIVSILQQENKNELIQTLVQSSVYRVLLSKALVRDNIYYWIGQTEGETYQGYDWQSYHSYYILKDPSQMNVIAWTNEPIEISVFEKEDLLMLQYCSPQNPYLG